MTWLTLVLTAVTALGGGAGLVALLTVRAQRRNINAKADQTLAATIKTLGTAAADMVEPLQHALDAAETRADTLGAQLRKLRTEVEQVREEAEAALAELRRLRRAILDPTATIKKLRAMVQPRDNGQYP
jgi:predicted  nucleic acid-binding Zn-ribbon protein